MQPTFPTRPKRSRRRQCLRAVGGLGAGASGVRLAQAGELPRNTEPRAISGAPVDPDWKQRVTIMVGPKDADLVAITDRVIKAAVDYVAEAVPCGSCRAPTGCTTPSVSSREPASWGARPTRCYSWSRRPPPDSSWTAITGIRRSRRPIPAGFAWETVSDSSPRIRTARARTSSSERSSPPRAIASSSTGAWRSGSTSRGPLIATIFALLRCTNVSDVTIENVTGDGNKAHNEFRPAKNATCRFGRPRTEASYAHTRVRRGPGRSNWSSGIRLHSRAGRCQAPCALLGKHGAPARHQCARVGNGRGR